ncbi:amidohydrolase family protein [Paenibacillus sp. GP183]|uniref:N-acetylglucosamine-6-phosphate deacetylase n=1 Tax=Paenibacillus sp. GP183 TaxID=1882751 RepID=UPI00089ABAA4|nr:amidohydrolase family protein [Paenibacillus sp. GP183]SEC77645.1 N-acetylglucosamine-6-phosphate deacetylase [Paenibacillus sp. GP183]
MSYHPIIQGLHYQTGQPVQIKIKDGWILSVDPLNPSEKLKDELPWVGPGLIDLQLNGFQGMDFNALPIPSGMVGKMPRLLWKEGITSYYPTVITNSEQAIEEAVGAIARECAEDSVSQEAVAGIHLEGPFISPEDGARGAHPQAFVKPPDWELFERWQEAAQGRIRIITLSPEWPEVEIFIRRCVETGVIVSIGHTAATAEQISRAVEAGASMSTHFGNGAHSMLPRHPNYLWEQLANDKLWASLIADGYHLPDSVLKVAMKVKGERAILVSDAVMLSGMPAGIYNLHIGGKVELTPLGRLQLADNPQLLAGSAQMLLWGIFHLVKYDLCSLGEAWDMASTRPATKMGLPAKAGLRIGAPADLTLLKLDYEKAHVVGTYKNGNQVFDSIS